MDKRMAALDRRLTNVGTIIIRRLVRLEHRVARLQHRLRRLGKVLQGIK